MKQLWREQLLPYPKAPCNLCGDPRARVQAHDEDYGIPYLWTPPAMYVVCRTGHAMIHLRFRFPDQWADFKAHLRRGGSCGQWGLPWQRGGNRKRLEQPEMFGLGEMVRARRTLTGEEWWERLTIDPASLTASWARPRGGEPPAATT